MAEWEAANPEPQTMISHMADHIDHIRDTIGVEYIGIGADFDGMPTGPVGFEDTSGYPALFAELARRGYSQVEMELIASRNAIRVLREAELYAASVSRALSASVANRARASSCSWASCSRASAVCSRVRRCDRADAAAGSVVLSVAGRALMSARSESTVNSGVKSGSAAPATGSAVCARTGAAWPSSRAAATRSAASHAPVMYLIVMGRP